MSASRKPRPTTKFYASVSLLPIFELIFICFIWGTPGLFNLGFQREIFSQMRLLGPKAYFVYGEARKGAYGEKDPLK